MSNPNRNRVAARSADVHPPADIKKMYPLPSDPTELQQDILVALYGIQAELAELRAVMGAIAGIEDEYVDYRDKTVEVPENSNDFEIPVTPSSKLAYLTFSHDAHFKVNDPSGNLIFHEASSVYEIGGFRTNRIYVTTGDTATYLNIRLLLTRQDLTAEAMMRS